MSQILSRKGGIEVVLTGEGELLVAGKPAQFIQISGEQYKAIAVVFKHRRPKSVIGARKRKKALQAAVRKLQWSTYLTLEEVVASSEV